jgi:hypothetical protein
VLKSFSNADDDAAPGTAEEEGKSSPA